MKKFYIVVFHRGKNGYIKDIGISKPMTWRQAGKELSKTIIETDYMLVPQNQFVKFKVSKAKKTQVDK